SRTLLREPLRALASLLSRDRPAEFVLDWLRQEGAEPLAPSLLPTPRLGAGRTPTPGGRKR
ncbi:MAG: hypothetical protein ACTS5I_11030, partial [Rhodanobacter sp.]